MSNAAGFAQQVQGQLEHGEQPSLDGDRTVGRSAVDPHDLAVRPVDRHLAFQLLDQIQCLQRGFRRPAVLSGIEKTSKSVAIARRLICIR